MPLKVARDRMKRSVRFRHVHELTLSFRRNAIQAAAPDARGAGVGSEVLSALQEAVRGYAPADFGFLGCREEVVPFYESCGHARIHSLVLDVSPRDAITLVRSHGPTVICAGTRSVDDWPEGAIDLRGLPW